VYVKAELMLASRHGAYGTVSAGLAHLNSVAGKFVEEVISICQQPEANRSIYAVEPYLGAGRVKASASAISLQ
jgi:hypothetical protein